MNKERKSRHSSTEKSGMLAVQQVFNQIGWITRPQHECDMGIDLHAEECRGGDTTGRLLALQVKSGKSHWCETKDGRVVFRFEQEHYDYWTSYSLPVLVVLYHPEDEKLIWQQITPKNCTSTGTGWKTAIPLDQELSSGSVDDLSRIARKPSLQDAVREKEERLESLDPRFTPKIAVSDGNEHTTFHAKEDVQIQIGISGKDIREKWVDLFEKGKPVEFSQGEISFAGSPVFEQIPEELPGPIKVQISHSKRVAISLIALDQHDNLCARIDSIPATLTAGKSVFSVQGGLEGSPLNVALEEDRRPGGKGELTLGFEITSWFEKPLLLLPYFDQICGLLKSLGNGSRLGLECYSEGNMLLSRVVPCWNEQLAGQLIFIEVVRKARYVARRFALSVNLPRISREQTDEIRKLIDEIEDLYELLEKGEVTTTVPDLRLECRLLLDTSFLERPEMNSVRPFQISLGYESRTMPFLGESVEVGPMSMSASSVLVSNREAIKRALRRGTGKREIELILEGTDNCELTSKLKQPPS